MIATIDYIEHKFQEFNELMFGGELQPLPFKITRARTYLGQIRFFKDRLPGRRFHYRDFLFVISSRIDRPEAEIEDTIIHEMIHYWVLSNQMQDSGPHGRIFKSKMQEINQKFNRQLSIVHKSTKEEADRDREVRQHFICLSRFRDGKCGVTVAAKTRLFSLWNAMRRFPNLAEQRWFVTTNPYFNRFPRSLTPKYYPVPSEELAEHLSDAQELEKVGKRIGIMNVNPNVLLLQKS